MRVVGVIQARMGSARLPGKVLMPLAGAPMLQRLVERIRRSKRIDALVVATTDRSGDDAIEELCRSIGAETFRGSERDVLDRMVAAARNREADVVVRLTADNPMVDGALVDDLLARFLPRIPRSVYAHNIEQSGFPYGLYAEAAWLPALESALVSNDPLDREHVTRFLRNRPEDFAQMLMTTDLDAESHSVTVDTAEDYTRVNQRFEALFARNPEFTYLDVLEVLAGPRSEVRPAVGE